MNTNTEKLQRAYNELLEYKLVLQKAGDFFHHAQSSATAQQKEFEEHHLVEGSMDSPLLLEQEMTTDISKQVKLGYVSGLVAREKSMAFERILFRTTSGNVLKQNVVEEPVIDPVQGEKVEKNVFVVFYSGERAKNKVLNICDAFGANRYPFTDDIGKRCQMITEVSGKLSELKTTIDVGSLHWSSVVQAIANQFEQWNNLVKKEKSIYHTLNTLSFDVTKKCLVAEGWCPVFATNQDIALSKRLCKGQQLTLTHRLEPFLRFCTPRNHHLRISGQTNLLLLFKRLLMLMGLQSIKKQILAYTQL